MAHFSSEGLDLFYLDVCPVGQDLNEPVLLVHGFASNHAVNWVNTLWVKVLSESGRRVIAFDNRGHGASAKPHDAAAYHTDRMASDARNLLDHLGIERADVMGYSMGARITAFLAQAHPHLVRSAVLGGLGYHLIEGGGLPQSIVEAMRASSLAEVTDPMGRMFRRFAESTGSDLAALAACISGSRQNMTPDMARQIECPVLVAVGTKDAIAGDADPLAKLVANGRTLDITNRDHNLAVGDKLFKAGVLAFLDERP